MILRILLLLLALSGAALAGCRSGALLATPVPDLSVRDVPAIQALFEAGRKTGVCFEVEGLAPQVLDRRVTVNANQQPLSEFLGEVFPAGPQVAIRARQGVVHIFDPTHRVRLLRHSLASFKTGAADTAQSVSLALHQALAVDVCPKLKTISGKARGGDAKNKVAPIDVQYMSAESILNRTLANSSGGVWVAVQPWSRDGCELTSRIWTVLEFTDPMLDNSEAAAAFTDSLAARQHRPGNPH